MAITSEEIHNQSFTVDRKGYDVDEVDVFLEHVAAEIDGLNAEIDELTARLNELHDGGAFEDAPMDMDAAFAEPALPEQTDETADEAVQQPLSSDEKDERIAELERRLAEKENDASAIANALVVAQRSAKEVVDAANGEAKRIKADAEADAADIIDRANAEKARIEDAIDELDRSHKETCETYAESLKAFIEDAGSKLDDIEEELEKKDGKKRAHARFASPSQAPVHKPVPAGATGAIAPSYTAPASAAPATPVTIPVTPKPSKVEKDLSGYGDASDAFDLGDID